MTEALRVVERPAAWDGGDRFAAAAALASRAEGPFVVYEHPDALCWAEGVRAEVVVTERVAVLEVDGRRREFPVDGDPFAAAGRALAALPGDGWRAYGWAAFELAHVAAGEPAPGGPLAHLVIPEREARFTPEGVVLRAGTTEDLDLLESRLAEPVPASPAAGPVPVDVDGHDADLYRKSVAAAVAEIRAGRLDKVILSRLVPVPGEVDFPATYLAGRRGNTPARSFLLDLGGWEAVGFSPEIVASVSGEGVVVTQPLAGTRALYGDTAFDIARRDELYRDAKEVFEHAISVRLATAEMAGVCAPGTVRVNDFMSVKERGSVQHLASEVTGALAEGVTAWSALAALFPAITASGVPKAAACELIREVEQDRGLYSGAVLVADADGSLDAALVLRSAYRREGRTWLRAGAGVVAQSTPERELEETGEKLRSVSRFLVGG